MRKTRGDREAGADAQGAERTRIHPLPGAARPHRLSRYRHDVAAVADINGVVGQELVQFPGDAIGMNRHAVRFEQRHELLGRDRLRIAQLLEPLLARLPLIALDAPGGGLQHGAEDRAGIPDQAESMSRFLPTVR
jgi:hypothetical protein